jgi:hypothetical protein
MRWISLSAWFFGSALYLTTAGACHSLAPAATGSMCIVLLPVMFVSLEVARARALRPRECCGMLPQESRCHSRAPARFEGANSSVAHQQPLCTATVLYLTCVNGSSGAEGTCSHSTSRVVRRAPADMLGLCVGVCLWCKLMCISKLSALHPCIALFTPTASGVAVTPPYYHLVFFALCSDMVANSGGHPSSMLQSMLQQLRGVCCAVQRHGCVPAGPICTRAQAVPGVRVYMPCDVLMWVLQSVCLCVRGDVHWFRVRCPLFVLLP